MFPLPRRQRSGGTDAPTAPGGRGPRGRDLRERSRVMEMSCGVGRRWRSLVTCLSFFIGLRSEGLHDAGIFSVLGRNPGRRSKS